MQATHKNRSNRRWHSCSGFDFYPLLQQIYWLKPTFFISVCLSLFHAGLNRIFAPTGSMPDLWFAHTSFKVTQREKFFSPEEKVAHAKWLCSENSRMLENQVWATLGVVFCLNTGLVEEGGDRLQSTSGCPSTLHPVLLEYLGDCQEQSIDTLSLSCSSRYLYFPWWELTHDK